MTVNIVSPWSIKYDHILRRMTDRLPWPVTDKPRPDALNYFFPYHAYEATGGPTATLFSHDVGHRNWSVAARETDLRIAWTRLYSEPLAEHGPAVQIPPGIDFDLFVPDAHSISAPIIGTAGIVYGDGRKGADLWARLVKESEPAGMALYAAGEGWAGDKCARIPHKLMPSFYQTLNVFVCTSRIEGVPMPPLEALACGIKVVIPRGVGLLDELPAIPGIERYDAGNYAEMRWALAQALGKPRDADALRAAVAPYTWDKWVEGHMIAFEEYI